MSVINVLDNATIDKIAAGEVVERPMSVVKELVENSIDSGATIITVEIKNGGLKLIRVTDNGSGIEKEQVRKAFVSHATSKIKDASDLNALFTLGFRGEALSSIAAVSRAELTTRTSDALTGIHYCIEGGREVKCEEVGAPAGTTILIRDIFYNTLPRLKFLKSEMSEGGYVSDLMEHLALSRPDISFQFINNGQTRFSTSGRGDLKEVIYRLFGKDISSSVRSIDATDEELSMHITGYLGLPRINRSNRACEIFYINRRYVKSPLLSRAVEEGYVEYLMQHKFPFCILNLEFAPEKVDVNVHPTKQEVRLSEERDVHRAIVRMISQRLSEREMIDAVSLNTPEEKAKPSQTPVPQLFETNRIKKYAEELGNIIVDRPAAVQAENDDPVIAAAPESLPATVSAEDDFFCDETTAENKTGMLSDNEKTVSDLPISTEVHQVPETVTSESPVFTTVTPDAAISPAHEYKDFKQLDFLDNERVLSPEARRRYRIIGQVFKTYWLIELDDKLLLMDQHAAHEKVRFERIMAAYKSGKEVPSQVIMPPEVISLSGSEKLLVLDNMERFNELGFVLEEFGEREIIIRQIPLELYGSKASDLFLEIIKDLSEMKRSETPDSIRTRIATMACKSAIKGNNTVSVQEIESLLDEMLTLDNPYNCPHGRPTMITMSKQELEKRFHRIV